MPSRVTGVADAVGRIGFIKEYRTIPTVFTRIWVAALNLFSAVLSRVTIFTNANDATSPTNAITIVFAWIWGAITGRYGAVLPRVPPTAHAPWLLITKVDTRTMMFARIWIAERGYTRLVAIFPRVPVSANTMVTCSGTRSHHAALSVMFAWIWVAGSC